MADPSIGLTFSDLILRVAEYLGVAYYGAAGDQMAQVPVDVHDLDLCKRMVNDGYRRFVTESPLWRFMNVPFYLQFITSFTGSAAAGSTGTSLIVSGLAQANNFFNGYGMTITHADGTLDVYTVTSWTLATQTFVLSLVGTQNGTLAVNDTYEMAAATAVEGQNYRYYLPDDFGGVLTTPFIYDVNGPRLQLNSVDESRIRELRAGANTSGTPSVVAVRPINTTATTTGKRWEALFWPKPAGVNRVGTVYRRFPQAMVNLTDRSVAGFQHDDTILAASIAEAERQRNDTIGAREQNYQAALARSKKIDSRSASDKVSDFGDRSEDRAGGGRPLNYYRVSTYNGNALN